MTEALKIVGGLLTPLIAIIATYIAVQQHNTQREKLRLDLYDKRMAVFTALTNLFGHIGEPNQEITFNAIVRFTSETASAEFLFGPEIPDYLSRVVEDFAQSRRLMREYERQRGKEETHKLIEAENAVTDRLIAATKEAKNLFAPYVNFTGVRETPEPLFGTERIFVRLLFLIGVVSLVGFGATAALAEWRANIAQTEVTNIGKRMVRSKAACQAQPRSASCDAVRLHREEFNATFAELRRNGELADRMLMLAWSVPLGCVLLFYGGRWVVTAKLRPFRP